MKNEVFTPSPDKERADRERKIALLGEDFKDSFGAGIHYKDPAFELIKIREAIHSLTESLHKSNTEDVVLRSLSEDQRTFKRILNSETSSEQARKFAEEELIRIKGKIEGRENVLKASPHTYRDQIPLSEYLKREEELENLIEEMKKAGFHRGGYPQIAEYRLKLIAERDGKK